METGLPQQQDQPADFRKFAAPLPPLQGPEVNNDLSFFKRKKILIGSMAIAVLLALLLYVIIDSRPSRPEIPPGYRMNDKGMPRLEKIP